MSDISPIIDLFLKQGPTAVALGVAWWYTRKDLLAERERTDALMQVLEKRTEAIINLTHGIEAIRDIVRREW